MLPNDLQDLRHVDVDPLAVPPLLFTVVAREKQNFGPIGQDVFDLDYVSLMTLGAVH
ncbi:MAG: hypothetical protein ACR2NL_05855 [Acidimicrobiia bacterium]